MSGMSEPKASSEVSADGKTLTILVKGRFDFSAHQEFRNAYEKVNYSPKHFIVNLKETTYLDSSALGMLLLLRDHAGGDNSDVRLTHVSPDVKKILAISNFEKLFTVES